MSDINIIYDAETIAAHIIKFSNQKGISVTNLRLQKLLYFVQGLSLSNINKPAFIDDIEAWNYGPVVPNVYAKYAYKGSYPIEDNEVKKLKIDFSSSDLDSFYSYIDYDDIEEDIQMIINKVIDVTSLYSDFRLVDITHSEGPWKNTFSKSNIHRVIKREDIKKHFDSLNGK